MKASQLLADIDAGRVTEVAQAACSYYSAIRGLTVQQTYYMCPSGAIVALNYVDGSYEAIALDDEAVAIFSLLYLTA